MNKKHLTREALLKIIEIDQAQYGETSALACIVLAAIDNGISLARNIVPEEMNIGTAMKEVRNAVNEVIPSVEKEVK